MIPEARNVLPYLPPFFSFSKVAVEDVLYCWDFLCFEPRWTKAVYLSLRTTSGSISSSEGAQDLFRIAPHSSVRCIQTVVADSPQLR